MYMANMNDFISFISLSFKWFCLILAFLLLLITYVNEMDAVICENKWICFRTFFFFFFTLFCLSLSKQVKVKYGCHDSSLITISVNTFLQIRIGYLSLVFYVCVFFSFLGGMQWNRYYLFMAKIVFCLLFSIKKIQKSKYYELSFARTKNSFCHTYNQHK